MFYLHFAQTKSNHRMFAWVGDIKKEQVDFKYEMIITTARVPCSKVIPVFSESE